MMRDLLNRCPDHEALVRAFLGEAGGAEQEALARHVLRCPSCGLKLDILRQIRREVSPIMEGLPDEAETTGTFEAFQELANSRLRQIRVKTAKPGGSRFLKAPFLAAAAALTIFIAVGAILLFRGHPAFGPLRKASGLEVRLVEPLGKLHSRPEVFRWSKVADADSYDFVLIDENLNTVYRAAIFFVAELAIPKTVENRLERGKVYVWEVQARDDKSAVLCRGKGTFTIR